MDTYSIIDYVSYSQSPRNKITLQQNLVSFLDQGEKVVYYADTKTTITNNQFAILSSGNCLMTEKLPLNDHYGSTMLFFDDTVLSSFFVKYASRFEQFPAVGVALKKPFLVFDKDEFTDGYLASLKLIHTKHFSCEKRLLALKFEELMLYLFEMYPTEILSFQTNHKEFDSDFGIRKAVEENVTNNLRLEELAFLCNVSVSTFKRKFIRLYKEAPTQYFLKERLKKAKALLIQNENPSEVYYKVGYQNHSSFSQSFKQMYGLSPKDFKLLHMSDSKQLLGD
jgi:AraC-like DNA-binding protein